MFPMPHSHISRDSDPTLGSLSHPAASSGRRSQPLPQVQSINLTWNITDSKWTFCGGWQRIYSTFYTSLGVATWMGIPKRCPLCSHSLWSVCGSWCSSSPAPLSSASASCWRSMTTCTPASLGTSWAPATRTGRSSGELGVPVPVWELPGHMPQGQGGAQVSWGFLYQQATDPLEYLKKWWGGCVLWNWRLWNITFIRTMLALTKGRKEYEWYPKIKMI